MPKNKKTFRRTYTFKRIITYLTEINFIVLPQKKVNFIILKANFQISKSFFSDLLYEPVVYINLSKPIAIFDFLIIDNKEYYENPFIWNFKVKSFADFVNEFERWYKLNPKKEQCIQRVFKLIKLETNISNEYPVKIRGVMPNINS